MLSQIMTTEEWYTIMWGLIDAEFRYSSIYFYAVIVFGSYFFWNIFINGVIAIFLRLNMEHTVRCSFARLHPCTATSCPLPMRLFLQCQIIDEHTAYHSWNPVPAYNPVIALKDSSITAQTRVL